jgi:two-component system sensor histidine kinase YesM
MGETEELCGIVDALGSYYRLCLSKGREIITIEEEINIVRNYLKIQQTRFKDIFSVRYELDERCGNYKILKLILQPLVENALHHGVRAKGEHGTILIKSEHLGDCIHLTVEDDGAGMSEEDLKKILNSNIGSESSSFGLRGTIERLRIFYGSENAVSIKSTAGVGTRIVITVPVLPEEGEKGNGYAEGSDRR